MVSTPSVPINPTFGLAAKDAVKIVGETMGKVARILVAAVLLSGMPAPSSAQSRTVNTEKGPVLLSVVARGLAQPWGMDVFPNGAIILTEKPGRLRILDREGKLSAPLGGVPPVADVGQGGLLDVTVDPAFASNRLLWLAYSEPASDGANSTAVARARLSADGTTLEGITVVFRQLPRYPGGLHFGARVVFARDGTMFVTLGERFQEPWREQAQDLGSHLGKVVRLEPDGTAPSDNPFIGRDDALPELWSYGHRNVQGAAIHPETGKLWISEHGPRGGDELNILKPGGELRLAPGVPRGGVFRPAGGTWAQFRPRAGGTRRHVDSGHCPWRHRLLHGQGMSRLAGQSTGVRSQGPCRSSSGTGW